MKIFIYVVDWPIAKLLTSRNSYSFNLLLGDGIITRRIATSSRKMSMELMFIKHAAVAQISELFCKLIEHFIDTRRYLLSNCLSNKFMGTHAPAPAQAIYEKTNMLRNCVCFIDGTFIGIAGPTGHMEHIVTHNYQNRKKI